MIPSSVPRSPFLLLISVAAMLALLFWATDHSHGETASTQQSLAAWDKMLPVLQSPRCLNCHQPDAPLQGDDRHIHMPRVARGLTNHGVGPLICSNCHGSGNNETSGTPGAGPVGLWALPPASMAWQDLSSGDLCRRLTDKDSNGNRDGQALIDHTNTEPLLLWSWNPGGNRTPVAMPHDAFIEVMKTWVAGGSACPK